MGSKIVIYAKRPGLALQICEVGVFGAGKAPTRHVPRSVQPVQGEAVAVPLGQQATEFKKGTLIRSESLFHTCSTKFRQNHLCCA